MTPDPRIDAYIESAAPFAQPILRHVRERVHAVVPDAQEDIKWRMPTYLRNGSILIVTAAFKQHAAVNFWRGKEIENTHQAVGALGQFGRLISIADLPPDEEFDRLIREAADRAGVAAPRKRVAAPKPSIELHPDFAAALDAHPAAKQILEGFPASARRDYLEWIADAKQEGTRAKRIASAIEWLSEGKRRNWKYERC